MFIKSIYSSRIVFGKYILTVMIYVALPSRQKTSISNKSATGVFQRTVCSNERYVPKKQYVHTIGMIVIVKVKQLSTERPVICAILINTTSMTIPTVKLNALRDHGKAIFPRIIKPLFRTVFHSVSIERVSNENETIKCVINFKAFASIVENVS